MRSPIYPAALALCMTTSLPAGSQASNEYEVDWIYIPEPPTALLLARAVAGLARIIHQPLGSSPRFS